MILIHDSSIIYLDKLVIASPYQWYGLSLSPRIADTDLSLTPRIADNGFSLTLRIGELSIPRMGEKRKPILQYDFLKKTLHICN
jgi:hypothetical protein